MNPILFLVLPPAVILFLRYLFVENNLYLSRKTEKVLLVLSIFCLALSISAEAITRHNLYFAGYRTTSYIMFVTSVVALVYYLLGTPNSKLKGLQTLKVIIVSILMINALFVTDGFKFSYKKYLLYNEGKYRIEKINGFMAPNACNLFINEGIFDRKYYIDLPYYISADSALVVENINDSISILIYHHSLEADNPFEIKMKP